MSANPQFGAFVISLDFELYWGIRDALHLYPNYRDEIARVRDVVPALLETFTEFEVGATWATVGLMFADSAADAEKFRPAVLPGYNEAALCPFPDLDAKAGLDPSILFAPDLIRAVRETPLQELSTHTFSHFYCLEDGQTREAFAADIDSAVRIAERDSVTLSSIVFPRNQHNPAYDDVLAAKGVTCFRGNQDSWMYQFDAANQRHPVYRIARLADTYFPVSGHNTIAWSDVWRGSVANVPASMFLRPVASASGLASNLQFRRIAAALEYAAKRNRIFHLWWHPHNFSDALDENIAFLRRILVHFDGLRKRYGMRAMTMTETADAARGQQASAAGA